MSSERFTQAAHYIHNVTENERIIRDGDPYYSTEVMPDGTLIGEQSHFERTITPDVAGSMARVLGVAAAVVHDHPELEQEHSDGGPCTDLACQFIHEANGIVDLILGFEVK